jgi:hypothetical protein
LASEHRVATGKVAGGNIRFSEVDMMMDRGPRCIEK